MAEPDQAAFWDERYTAKEYLFGTAPNAFLMREVHRLAPGSKVLAIADGEGRNSVFLAQHGHRVVATDVSARALACYQRAACHPESDFRGASCRSKDPSAFSHSQGKS